jgi:recombination protein RecA
LIIVDSVAALVPRQEIEGNMGDSHVGLQARLMSQALRKLTAVISKSNTAVIFINQTRMKIGAPPYVNPETTTGGVALKFYSSVRIEVRNAGAIKDAGGENQVVGARTRVKIVKNKFAPPFKTIEFPIIFGEGISHLDIILEMASSHDIIKKSGSWFSYGDIRLGQGADKTKQYLRDNPELIDTITDQLKAIIKPEHIPVSPETDDSDLPEEI